mgnify:CR=1 FL=1
MFICIYVLILFKGTCDEYRKHIYGYTYMCLYVEGWVLEDQL